MILKRNKFCIQTKHNETIIPDEGIIMKKWNADLDRRSKIDRRSGIDRRLSNDLTYFSSGGIERRVLDERRSGMERRSDWLKISKYCSVYMTGASVMDISGDAG